MQNVNIPVNDFGYNFAFTLYQKDGTTVFDTTGYTVTLKAWLPGIPATLIISGVCVMTDDSAGEGVYTLLTTDFVTVRRLHAEIEATKTGSRESFETFSITVTESG